MPVRDYSSEPDQDKEVDIESQLSPLDSRNSTLHITNGREYRNSLVGPSYIDNHRTVSGPATRFESTEKESNEISDKKESAVHLEETRSSESHPPRRWQQRPNFRWPARWRITWTRAHYVLTSGIFIGFIVMLVLYLIEKHSTRKAPIVSSNDIVATNFTQPSNPNNTTISSILLQPVDVPPLLDTSLGATVIRFGKLLSNTTSEDQTILVYNGPNGKLCIRWKTGNSFRNNVQCVEGANAKDNTPITVLDWFGTTSIYFINTLSHLSGLDNIPTTNEWRISTLASKAVLCHELSQLSSTTWLDGESAWIYYQDVFGQIQEYGMDDYRDKDIWRPGSTGPLKYGQRKYAVASFRKLQLLRRPEFNFTVTSQGLALNGTGIAVARWLSNGAEILELYIQATNTAIHGRVFINSVWSSEWYSVSSTSNTVSEGTSISSTTITAPTNTSLLLTYISKAGFLTIQSRDTRVEDYKQWTTPIALVEGDGKEGTGIAVVSVGGKPVVYLAVGQRVMEVSAEGVAVGKEGWKELDITG